MNILFRINFGLFKGIMNSSIYSNILIWIFIKFKIAFKLGWANYCPWSVCGPLNNLLRPANNLHEIEHVFDCLKSDRMITYKQIAYMLSCIAYKR